MGNTFVFYSWDIMEPISYVMLLANFTVGAMFYATNKKDMQLQTLSEILAGRIASRIYRKRKLNIKRVEELEEEINRLRSHMNKIAY
jgi:Mitochondrial calcium uniporter